jgi:hypothetical protein
LLVAAEAVVEHLLVLAVLVAVEQVELVFQQHLEAAVLTQAEALVVFTV